MIEIDGPLWFVAALVIWVLLALHLRGWRRERREYMEWRERRDKIEQARHDEFMRVMGRDDDGGALGWKLDGNRERGQA